MNTPATSPMSWNNVINMWYNEVNSYVYGGANNGGAVTGHFTQVPYMNEISSFSQVNNH
jgi:hypothetical protein